MLLNDVLPSWFTMTRLCGTYVGSDRLSKSSQVDLSETVCLLCVLQIPFSRDVLFRMLVSPVSSQAAQFTFITVLLACTLVLCC